jgi:hypothetical protein
MILQPQDQRNISRVKLKDLQPFNEPRDFPSIPERASDQSKFQNARPHLCEEHYEFIDHPIGKPGLTKIDPQSFDRMILRGVKSLLYLH